MGTSVKHCRDTHWLGSAGIRGGWALQKYLVIEHCRETLRLGTAGILGGWSLKSASSRARTTSSLKSNNPTVRVGNKEQLDTHDDSGLLALLQK